MRDCKKTLNELVREEAKKNIGQYNFAKDAESRKIHCKICKKLVELADKYNYPMGVLVYIAIGTNAHRPIVFQQGYLRINEQKVERVITLCEIFAKKFGENMRTNDRLVHSVSRYVDINGGNLLKFRQLVNAMSEKEFRKFKTAKELTRALCGDEAEYSKAGYITSVNKPSRKPIKK